MPLIPQPNSRLRLRRDVSNRWTQINPILGDGEPGFEKDTGMLKVGDGVLTWNELPYFIPHDPGAQTTDLPAHIDSPTPHPVYDDGPSLALIYQNAKV